MSRSLRIVKIPSWRLKQIATGGAASVIASAVANNVVRLASNLTLTRLLLPEAFGITAIILSIQFMISLMSDVGFYDFIIQHKDGDDETFRDEVWSIRLVRGLVLTVVMLLVAYPLAIFLKKPVLAPVIAVWSFSFVLDGLSSLAWATAVRAQQFWRLSFSDLAANVIGTIVSVVLAFLFHSYWALVFGMAANAAGQLLCSYVVFRGSRRRWRFRIERARELWAFSRFITMASVLTLILMQADKLVLARMMPLYIFGLYGVASQLAAAPNTLSLTYTSRVLLGAYAQAAREGRDVLRRIFYPRRRKVGLFYMLLIGVSIGAAPMIIHILYRPNYYSVTPYFQLLLISSGLRFSSNSAKWALIAIGRTSANFYAQLWAVLWLVVGGGISIATHNILLLVAVVGMSETPSLICTWWYLRREHLLDLKAEGLELATGLVGLGGGWLVSGVVLRLWPHI